MKTMIMADTIPGKLEAGGFEFGKSQFREKSTVCYSWATNLQPPSGAPSSSTTVGLWELASSFPRILGVHPVAAGPLFFAVNEFERHDQHPMTHGASTFAEVILNIVEPFTRGFSYLPGRQINLQLIGCATSGSRLLSTGVSCREWYPNTTSQSYNHNMIDRCQECQSNPQCDVRIPQHKRARLEHIPTSSNYQNQSVTGGSITNILTTHQEFTSHAESIHNACPSDMLKHMLAFCSMSRYYLVLRCMNKTRCATYNTHIFESIIFGGVPRSVDAHQCCAQNDGGEHTLHSNNEMTARPSEIIIRDYGVPPEQW